MVVLSGPERSLSRRPLEDQEERQPGGARSVHDSRSPAYAWSDRPDTFDHLMSIQSTFCSRRGVLACVLIGAGLVAPRHAAGSPQTTVDVVRRATATAVTTEIVVDGALDEDVWDAAPKIGDLV